MPGAISAVIISNEMSRSKVRYEVRCQVGSQDVN